MLVPGADFEAVAFVAEVFRGKKLTAGDRPGRLPNGHPIHAGGVAGRQGFEGKLVFRWNRCGKDDALSVDPDTFFLVQVS